MQIIECYLYFSKYSERMFKDYKANLQGKKCHIATSTSSISALMISDQEKWRVCVRSKEVEEK